MTTSNAFFGEIHDDCRAPPWAVHGHENLRGRPAADLHADDGMGWLRLVGFLKLQVSFAEYRVFYRALSQKRPVIFRSLIHM